MSYDLIAANNLVQVFPKRAMMLHRRAQFEHILEVYDLSWVWQFVTDTNTGRENTYHNNEHMMAVAVMSWELYHLEYELTAEIHNYPIDVLLVAAMLHDYGHSGGRLTDEENVAIALDAVELIAGSLIRKYNEAFVEAVKDTIRVTQFPFVHTPTNILQRVIRDADVMQSFEANGVEVIMEGLRAELVNKDTGKVPTHEAMAKGQIAFLSNLELFTRSAKKRFALMHSVVQEAFVAYAYPTSLVKDDK